MSLIKAIVLVEIIFLGILLISAFVYEYKEKKEFLEKHCKRNEE